MSFASSLLRRVEIFAQRHAQTVGYGVITLLMIYLWVPILTIALMSFTSGSAMSFPPTSLSLKWYEAFLTNPKALTAVWTTLRVGAIVTPLTVVIATMLSWAIDRYAFRGKNVLQLLVTLPLIIPLIVIGIALTMFFGILNVDSGFWTIVAGHTLRALPFATLIILPTLLTFDNRLEEASMDLGANEFETFLQVTLPNIYQGIFAGALMAFTISFNEFVVTYFVKGTLSTTFPTWIWSMIRHRVTPEVNAASVVFLLVATALILLAVSLTHVERITMQE